MSEHTAENGLPACGSCGEPAPYTITLRGEPMPACLRHLNHWRDPHSLTMEVQDEPRMFRAVCSCGGYVGPWKSSPLAACHATTAGTRRSGAGAPMSERIHAAADRVRRFLDAREGFPIDVLAVVTRTGDRLLSSDLRALVEEVDPDPLVARFEGFLVDTRDKAWADGYNHAKVEMLSAEIGERAECPTCSGRGVWMDEPCGECGGRGVVDDLGTPCPGCVTPPAEGSDR